MRVRTILTVLGTALLLAGASPAPAAVAGTGKSMACSDGSGGTEHVVDDTVVTLAVEEGSNTLRLCYSTAGSGTPGQVTGGRIDVYYNAAVLTPSSQTIVDCSGDYQFGVAPDCLAYAFVYTDTSGVVVTPYPGYQCVLYVGPCQAWAPGATVATSSSPPVAEVDTFGTYVPVELPSDCVSLFVQPCP